MESRRVPGYEPGGATIAGEPASSDAEAADRQSASTTFRWRFPATDVSVRQARRCLLDLMAREGGGCLEGIDVVALMLSELATNAVQHARTEFEVAITVTPEAARHHLRVGVTDRSPGLPVRREQAADAPSGRGLRIVESLADAWGIEVHTGHPGKTVWFAALVGPRSTAGSAMAARHGSCHGEQRSLLEAALPPAASTKEPNAIVVLASPATR